VVTDSASKEKAKNFELQIKIPGLTDINPREGTSAIGEYIKAVYNYAIGIVGILSALVIMLGGVIWLTAGGNTNRIENAKSWITAALTGLVIALSSYLILYTINPDLINFQTTKPGTPPNYETGCCSTANNCETIIVENRNECEGDYYANKVCKNGKCLSSQLANCLYAVKSESECEQKCGDEEPLISASQSSGEYICCNCGMPETDVDGQECDYTVGGETECEQKCGGGNVEITATGELGIYCCHCNE
jgi:hypothetical protein